MSPPEWGAWIEISSAMTDTLATTSPPEWGAWIEIECRRPSCRQAPSPPEWGAWIEMAIMTDINAKITVAPRVGGVD